MHEIKGKNNKFLISQAPKYGVITITRKALHYLKLYIISLFKIKLVPNMKLKFQAVVLHSKNNNF